MPVSFWIVAILSGLISMSRTDNSYSFTRLLMIGYAWGFCCCVIIAFVPTVVAAAIGGPSVPALDSALDGIIGAGVAGGAISAIMTLFFKKLIK